MTAAGTTSMQLRRRRAFEEIGRATAPVAAAAAGPPVLWFSGAPDREDLDDLAETVTRLLLRDRYDGSAGPGYAVVRGATGRDTDVARLRDVHRALFDVVWSRFRTRSALIPDAGSYRTSERTVTDGRIPLEQFGSRWSFKELHADRDALLFSHLYGPARGFDGGELQIADVRRFLAGRRLAFDEVFRWSDEPTSGSKPVLRPAYHEPVLREYGESFEIADAALIVFVNNQPESGILHGARPVRIRDRRDFVREYHRCSARERDPGNRAENGGR